MQCGQVSEEYSVMVSGASDLPKTRSFMASASGGSAEAGETENRTRVTTTAIFSRNRGN